MADREKRVPRQTAKDMSEGRFGRLSGQIVNEVVLSLQTDNVVWPGPNSGAKVPLAISSNNGGRRQAIGEKQSKDTMDVVSLSAEDQRPHARTFRINSSLSSAGPGVPEPAKTFNRPPERRVFSDLRREGVSVPARVSGRRPDDSGGSWPHLSPEVRGTRPIRLESRSRERDPRWPPPHFLGGDFLSSIKSLAK